ncbi:cell division cycle protein 27 homolog [Condylostylus longicornis]|uniref:cell division cycle protein 27 homolog n=1 Tax=Condylostylus longicornis TaxID=2530218 RepID=UPI00244DCF78|nr:cell division cycle protein 27 homolog [Condylostylus longicornis]
MIIQEPVQAAIWHCLNHYNYKDATFLAERLCAEIETDETIFILATCYFRSNNIHQAYWLLKTKSSYSPQCRYLLAKCAYQLKKLVEAEAAISSINFNEIKNFEEIGKEFGEIACFVLQLIANICLQTERKRIAIEANKMALKLNPFLWHSFADLCNMGEKVDPNSIFQFSSADIFNTCQGNTNTNPMILFGNNGANSVIMLDACLITSAVGVNNNMPLNNTSTTINSSGDIINNTSSNNYILSTPGDNNLQTPINPPTNIRNIGGGLCNINNISIGPMHSIDDTLFSSSPVETVNADNCTPIIRKQFKYLSMRTPGSPSFGILPISPVDTPISGSNYFGGSNVGSNLTTPINNSNNNISNINNINNNIQSPQTLVEMNQEQKPVGKKLKGHVGGILVRKDSPIPNTKPTVFTQTGNITSRTPNNNSSQNVRRSSRLFSNNNYSVKENSSKSPNINSKFVQPRSPPRKTKSRLTKITELINEKDSTVTNMKKDKNQTTQVNEKIETITSATDVDSKVLLNNTLNSAQTMAQHVVNLKKQSVEGLMALLRDIGQSYLQLSQYNCTEAVTNFNEIPKRHHQSSWVQSQIALAYYEQRKYENAVEVFKSIHEKEPYRLQYMEIYSTVLWHLQKDVALSALAQDLMAVDKNSPVTWCVSGNCFSLHKEHETAIKFFKRAVQVDPNFVYSYTLLGHELIITEELEKAMNYFRTAITKDSRHYNAWFGIGTIYSKQERYELAELHYRHALKINPKNSIIIVHIGAMQFFMHKTEQALATLNTAATVDPKNPLCKFHRGSIYYQLGKHQEALKELEELKQIVPKESVVFYLIGKIHKTLGNVDKALMHFSWATDLDPKGANNQLKDAFDSINHNPRSNNETNIGSSNNSNPVTTNNADITNEANFGASISIATGLMHIEEELEIEPVSERSDDSTQAQHELDASYDNDSDNY